MSQSYKERADALGCSWQVSEVAASADAALAAAREERDALRAECEALRKDAERYRFLRAPGEDTADVFMCNHGERLDAACDATIAGRAGEKTGA